MDNPIDQTIMLVEEEQGEILESGDLNLELTGEGLPTNKYSDALKKCRFLRGLSTKLHTFRTGTY